MDMTINDEKLQDILNKLTLGNDGIYSYDFNNIDQEGEIKLRESEANKTYDNYFDTLSKHHSIPVMNREVKLFCNRMPKNATIPDFKKVVTEAHRALKSGGLFVNYSLNTQPIVKFIYKLLRKEYMVKGRSRLFYLSRASQEQKNIISKVFNQTVKERYSEIIFKPELKISSSGKEKSILGVLDGYLSNNIGLGSSIARQCSYHTHKK